MPKYYFKRSSRIQGKVNADSVEQVEMDSKEYQEMMGKVGELRENEDDMGKKVEEWKEKNSLEI